jgi:hypothetical protein
LLELLQIFVDNIAPILMIAGVGYAVGRRLQIEVQSLGRLIFYIFTPALVFQRLSTSDVSGGELGLLFILTMLFQVILALIAYITLRVRGVGPIYRANVMISAFSLNAGNYGLSLISFAFGPDVVARAAIIFIANITLNFTLGVYVASSGRKAPHEAVASILRVPAVYATAAAFIVNGFQIALPLPLERSISSLAEAAIPGMLILLGLQLARTARLVRPKLIGFGVVLKLGLSPFVAVILAGLVGLNDAARIAFILQTSMPVAVATIILATEFDLDAEFALGTILVSTLISPLTLSVLIFLLR